MKSSSEIFDDEVKYNTLKLLAYGYDRKEPKGYEIEYIVLFKKYRQYTIDFLDMEIFINLIFSLTEKKQFSEGLKYANLIISFQDSAPEQNLLNYLIIYHLRLNIYSYLNDKANAIETAKQILELARNEKVKNQKSNLLGSTGLDIITQNAESILRPKVKNIVPIKSSKIYTRNQILKVRSSGECRVLE